MPIVASVLVVIVCLASAGTTCVCVVGHHPNQAVEQVASAIPAALPAPPPTWTFAMVATLTGLMVVAHRRRSSGRASPEMLQRFLF
jgi:membrane protein implicated in regulation of membrane protease activity